MAKAPSIGPHLTRVAGKTVAALRKAKLSVVTAESCTAGLIAASLSLGDGASDVLAGGFTTYTKEQKAAALGVKKTLMADEGCVNAACVRAMASGALKHSKADIALAVSGVLGPKPDEDGNPVGLVFFCCQRRGRKADVIHKAFGFTPHDDLRAKTVLEALRLIRRTAGPRATRQKLSASS
jgi:nicotinamide-nucleotide amidase